MPLLYYYCQLCKELVHHKQKNKNHYCITCKATSYHGPEKGHPFERVCQGDYMKRCNVPQPVMQVPSEATPQERQIMLVSQQIVNLNEDSMLQSPCALSADNLDFDFLNDIENRIFHPFENQSPLVRQREDDKDIPNAKRLNRDMTLLEAKLQRVDLNSSIAQFKEKHIGEQL